MTMSSENWFEVTPPDSPLTQGDVVTDCPLLGWRAGSSEEDFSPEKSLEISRWADAYLRDVVVMTQACDLEHNKVQNVVLCPTQPLSEYRAVWLTECAARHQNPTEKSWRKFCDDVTAGYVWHQCLLSEFDHAAVRTEVRVVFFNEVYTLPRWFLQGLLVRRGQPRLRLRPPYREHLSQAFARFFMRVGLPQAINLPH
jgi:hypothetical protein